MGASASLIVLMSFASSSTSLTGYALMYGAMAEVTTWIFYPSLLLTLVAGLLAIAVNPAYHLIFEGGLVYVHGPIREEAKRSACALAGHLDPAAITGSYGAERSTLWFLLAVSLANVVLGIWRPRFTRKSV
jgi:hypothetical protein